MKLDSNKSWGDWYWVAHPDARPTDPVEKELVKHRYELEIIGGILDKDASYSYDDWALVEWKGNYYLFSTSGCSCPSPSETWRVEMGPITLEGIEKRLAKGEYAGYTVPGKQMDEFLALIQQAKKERDESKN